MTLTNEAASLQSDDRYWRVAIAYPLMGFVGPESAIEYWIDWNDPPEEEEEDEDLSAVGIHMPNGIGISSVRGFGCLAVLGAT